MRGMMGRSGRTLLAVAALAIGLGGARPARAEMWGDAGWGALSVLGNLCYMPAKLVYATFGAMTGGLAYGLTLGDSQAADTIWQTSMGGTYVLTPRMLQGEDPIAFAGTPSIEPAAGAGEAQPSEGTRLGSGAGSGTAAGGGAGDSLQEEHL